jgi:hypothetical protein
VGVADPEIDGLYAAILTVPGPQEFVPRRIENVPRRGWHRAATIAMMVIPPVICVAALAMYLFDLLTHNFVPEGNYLFLLNVTLQMLMWVVFCRGAQALERRFKLRQSQKPSMTIFPSGIALDGQFVTWENIASCRWNHFSAETLVIAVDSGHSHCRHAVVVPESHRAIVEGTFRRFGKWDEPWTLDEWEKPVAVNMVDSESGMSINFKTPGAETAAGY